MIRRVATLCFALLALLFRFTRTGTAMRATAADQATAFGMGIDVRRVFSLSWILAAVTAALAGIVIGTIGGISPQLGAVGRRGHRPGAAPAESAAARVHLRRAQPRGDLHQPRRIPQVREEGAYGGEQHDGADDPAPHCHRRNAARY